MPKPFKLPPWEQMDYFTQLALAQRSVTALLAPDLLDRPWDTMEFDPREAVISEAVCSTHRDGIDRDTWVNAALDHVRDGDGPSFPELH